MVIRTEAIELPPLRDELTIDVGPRAHDGQPGWTLQDPARNRFFRIDWLTFEILQRWTLGDPELIVRQISDQTPLRAVIEDVAAVLDFLASNLLLKLAGHDNSSSLAETRKHLQPPLWEWLVHNYLFFRIPLIRPERLLRWLEQRLTLLFSPWFWRITAVVGVLGLMLVWRDWDAFSATWGELANLNGAVSFIAVIVGVKVLHELGHGVVATHFGCRVPTMGMAFLVMTPVAYTDTNDAWKLPDRRSRLLIGAAGVLAELSLAVWATLAWALLPDGYLRSAAFIVATTTWIKSLLINTSPVMRFDGYYLLSDALDIPNLHTRAFAYARWQLREWLFQLGEQPPERFRRPLARGIITLAFFIWVYRLVVFTGIAVFVYHYFFKALGIVCFTIEMGWFVTLPIIFEMKVWFEKRQAIARSLRARRLGLGLAALFILLCIPWPQRIRLAAEWTPQNEFKIVADDPAQLVDFVAADGAHVKPGDLLLKLSSDVLEHRLAIARVREESAKAQAVAAESDPAMRAKIPTLRGVLATAAAARRAAEAALENLTPRAPFAGVFRISDCDLKRGEAIEHQEEIATLVGDGGWQAVGYVDEQYRHLIVPGAKAWFYPNGCPDRRVPLTLVSVDRDAARTISNPMLTTAFGGPVPARLVDGNLVPERGLYRVRFETSSVPADLATAVRGGTVVVVGKSESLVARFGRAVAAVVWREAGF